MMENEEKQEHLENTSSLIDCDIENLLVEKCHICINIFKIVLLCLCVIIIVIPVTKKNMGQSTKPISKPTTNNEEKIEQKPEEKNKPKPTDKQTDTEPDKKTDTIPVEKTDNKQSEKADNKIIEKTDEIYSNYTNETQLVNLYISTHKDFKCDDLKDSSYKILCDDMSQLKNNYSLETMPTYKDNELYPKRRAYGECSKMYYIWKLYKSGNISSKYVGFFHYRRLFKFRNNIPDLDDIFSKNDIILPRKVSFRYSLYNQFKDYHVVHFLDESIEIIKEKFPDYYPYAHKALSKKTGYFCNIFIMKKNDFIKWGNFVYGIILELDRKYNLTSDNDIKKLMSEEVKKHKTKRPDADYQSRLEGFIIERLGNIFYDRHFAKKHELGLTG